jgi:cytoskeletal protein RodZ
MAQKKSRKKLYTALIVLAILLVVIGVIALVRGIAGNGKNDPYKQTTTQQTPDTSSNSQPSTTPDDNGKNSPTTQPSTTTPKIDPSTADTIDIPPMNITVSYVKGVGGFEYEVLRTANGTQYVEFRSTDLVGTKCTNDQGAFASILASPTDDESSTLSQKIEVGGTTYGLSLAGSNCTSNPDLLAKYQKSFSDAFTLLKKM